MNVLHLEASPRGAQSHSRQVSETLVAAIKAAKPDATITYRDLNEPVVPHVTGEFVRAALYGLMAGETPTPEGVAALAFSDTLVAEIQAADVIVLATPMYNFGLPSVAKAYIDQVVRTGKTVIYDATGPVGQLNGKKMIAVTAYGGGGYGRGEARESANFVDGHIRTAFGFIGITDITFVPVQGTLGGEASVQSVISAAHGKISEIVAAL